MRLCRWTDAEILVIPFFQAVPMADLSMNAFPEFPVRVTALKHLIPDLSADHASLSRKESPFVFSNSILVLLTRLDRTIAFAANVCFAGSHVAHVEKFV